MILLTSSADARDPALLVQDQFAYRTAVELRARVTVEAVVGLESSHSWGVEPFEFAR